MKTNKLPDIKYMNQALAYDQSSPSGLRWLSRPASHFRTRRGNRITTARDSGNCAGSKAKTGDGVLFWRVKINQVVYPAHRVVWALCSGKDPGEKEIDHIDRNSLNNKIENLRTATRGENASNKGVCSTNTSGVRGVTWCKRTACWMAQIGHQKKTIFLGRFKDILEAKAARDIASHRIHQEFRGEASCFQATAP